MAGVQTVVWAVESPGESIECYIRVFGIWILGLCCTMDALCVGASLVPWILPCVHIFADGNETSNNHILHAYICGALACTQICKYLRSVLHSNGRLSDIHVIGNAYCV